MTRNKLIEILEARGFLPCQTASPRWMGAYYASSASHTLLVLFRRRGIDVFQSPQSIAEITGNSGCASVRTFTPGARFVELSYMESEPNIHAQVLTMVDSFVHCEPIPVHYFNRQGVSIGEMRQRHRSNVEDLYVSLCVEPGLPVYLEGGLELTHEGRISACR